MKLSLLLLTLAAMSFGQDDQDMKTWMKTIGSTMPNLRKDMEAKSADDVTKDGQTISDTYKKVESFFAAKNADDAVTFAKNARTSADDMVAAAKGGDWDKAGASAKAIGQNCGPCHMAHREKLPDGGYKIK